jgi:hypothetical protein
VSLTACGRYAAQIATSYGVTVSYLPLFDNVSTLLFGNSRIPRMDESGVELLVNRGMNVWGSGGAHRTYFKKVDEIIVEIFNRPLQHAASGHLRHGLRRREFSGTSVFRGEEQDRARQGARQASVNSRRAPISTKWRAGSLNKHCAKPAFPPIT